MELTGKVISLLPMQTGMGKNGPWKKQEYIIETGDKIARKVCFSLWGDKIAQFQLAVGDVAEVSFDLESREFNNRWYTEVKAWKVVKQGSSSASMQEEPPADLMEPGPQDDLPF